MKIALTVCPGACLDDMAGQCPLGRLDATRGGLHRALTGSTTPRRFHWRVLMQLKHQRLHSKHRRRGLVKHPTGGDWWRWIPRGNTIQISSKGKFLRIPNGGVGRGSGGDHSIQASVAKVTEDGRSGQATVAAIQIASELEREMASGAGLGRFDRPRPEPVGLVEPSGPVGPAGLLGQQASWAKQAFGEFC
jgi:hypothetical protein